MIGFIWIALFKHYQTQKRCVTMGPNRTFIAAHICGCSILFCFIAKPNQTQTCDWVPLGSIERVCGKKP